MVYLWTTIARPFVLVSRHFRTFIFWNHLISIITALCFICSSNADGASASSEVAKTSHAWLLCDEDCLAEYMQSESRIANIKIPMTVERKHSSSCCSWRVRRRGLGSMTQTYTIGNSKPRRFCAFSSTSSLKIRWNYLDRVADADEFTCGRGCLLQANSRRCLNPRVVGQRLQQMSFDGSRNAACLPFWCLLHAGSMSPSAAGRDGQKGPTLRRTGTAGPTWARAVHHGRTEYRSGRSWRRYNPRFSSLFEMKRGHRGCWPAPQRMVAKKTELSALKVSSIFSPLQWRKANTRNKKPIQRPGLTLVAKHSIKR